MTPSFISEEPIVTLEAMISSPYDLAVATARTCYSSKGIIRSEDVSKDEKSKLLRDKIAKSTRDAGHLTTRQHAHFVFSIQKVSRQAVWSFLHSHPYYNSEQVSQRYVKVQNENWTIPNLDEKCLKIYQNCLQKQMAAYHQLIELLEPQVAKAYYEIFPIRKKWEEKYRPTVLKKAYEVARYVLPVATHTYLYHTISAITLLRYHHLSNYFDAPSEQKIIIQKMLEEVLKRDPEFQLELQDPLPLEKSPEFDFWNQEPLKQSSNTEKFIQEFDASLEGKLSKLIDYKMNAPQTLAQAVRGVFAKTKEELSDEEALKKLLDPACNPLLANTLNVNSLSKLNRCLSHAHYSFRKKLSHSADSQDQRHRTIPASRPLLANHYSGKSDYIVPQIVALNAPILEAYQKSMQESFDSINQLLNEGVSSEQALYLLPNAFPIRFEESGDLLNLHHKWHTRACYTAQDEIFYATLDEIKEVSKIHPQLTSHILAPCFIRKQAGIKPVCPEGERFCGVKVWEKSIEDYTRLL